MENELLLRTSENYEEDCSNLNSDDNNMHRIKFKSVINDLKYFKFYDCISVDIMHDILEGVAQLQIKLFLKALVEERKSLQVVNSRIHSFNYGLIEMPKKPSKITLEKVGNSIGQRAA